MVAATLRAGWERALAAAEKRLPALTRYRSAEPLPIRLHARRIYILPTGFGVFFGVVLAAMLLGALNFNNNAAILLTFLLAGAIVVTLPRTVAHLDKLELAAIHAEPVHAGNDLAARVMFEPGDRRARERLVLRVGSREPLPFEVDADGGSCVLTLPTRRRGWQPVGRLTLSTEFPLGLFRAWSVLHPEQVLLVYPRAEDGAPPLPRGAASAGGQNAKPHGEDWQGLREYRSGDAMRRIAWKASARHDRLLVKEFAEPQADEVTLDWQALRGLDGEARIARLTRWVLEASARGFAFRLLIPGAELGPGRGAQHTARCLRQLALLP